MHSPVELFGVSRREESNPLSLGDDGHASDMLKRQRTRPRDIVSMCVNENAHDLEE